MRLVYQMSVTGDISEGAVSDGDFDDAVASFLEENAGEESVHATLSDGADSAYFHGTLGTLRDRLGDIDALIAGASDHWKIGRIAKVDLAILRLAVCEMMYADDIPVAVAINEAVELAGTYGGDKSSEFVNGVLGRIARSDGDSQ
jgi:N utilization substance protein B